MGLFGRKKEIVPAAGQPDTDFKVLSEAVNLVFSSNFASAHDHLFDKVTQSIHVLTGACTVVLGKMQPDSKNIVSLSIWDKNNLQPNIEYSLEGTPCENVVGNQPCCYLNNVDKLFPKDTFLRERQLKAYIGVPLFFSDKKPMGLIAAMFDHDLKTSEVTEMVLKVFGIRVTGEIEYLNYSKIVEEQTMEMNLLLEQLKSKNKELDNSMLEMEKAKAFAEESNQLKTAFLANLSHEVRTPMNVMLGFAELLKSEFLTHEERIEYIDIINQNGFQLLKIMDNLIEISKFQSKRAVTNEKPFNLNGLLDRFFNNYHDYIGMMQKPVGLVIQKGLPDNADYVLADQEGISKVVDQLIDNAIKFTTKGLVEFGYERISDKLRFWVRDTGIGIPLGMEEKIFDMFRQVDLRVSREFGGNGLGLAIARKYSELMSGRVWVERNENEGACFYFEIPYKKAEPSELELASRN